MTINDEVIRRINELSRKKKSVGLTAEEMKEQSGLRTMYIDAIKVSLRNQLDQIEFVDEEKTSDTRDNSKKD